MNQRNGFKSGSSELLVLYILREQGDCYGYQISQLITKISDGKLSFPVGSLYPAFYKLIEHELISDYKVQTGKRMVKVFYHIEPKGLERLEELLTEYHETMASIDKILNHNYKKDNEKE